MLVYAFLITDFRVFSDFGITINIIPRWLFSVCVCVCVGCLKLKSIKISIFKLLVVLHCTHGILDDTICQFTSIIIF